MFNRNKKVWKQFDWPLLIVTVILCLFGLVVLFSAVSASQRATKEMLSQIIATGIGFVIIIILQFVDMDVLHKMAGFFYAISIAALLATLVLGFGEEQWGARSWLKLGPVTFQPSEFTKVGILIAFSGFLDRFKPSLNRFSILLLTAIYCGIPLFLILRQPDFGTTMVFLFFLALMVFYNGLHWGYIVGALALAAICVPILYGRLDNYQKERILNFLDPSRNQLGSNYQMTQGLIAIGSGQLFGRGFLMGTQTQYGFIPEQETDYIFSALVEEWGFVGGCVLILLYAFMIYRLLHIAKRAKDTFGSSLCVGIAGLFFIHIFENIGMTIQLMPVTGIPLPFFSYGGTFQLINLASIGLALSVGMQRKPLDFNVSL